MTSHEEQKKILSSCHVDSLSGHMGTTRTVYKINERFMWKGMVKDVKNMVGSNNLSYTIQLPMYSSACFY